MQNGRTEGRRRDGSTDRAEHGPSFGGDWARDPREGLGDDYARDGGWSGAGRADEYTREPETVRSYRGVGPKNWTSEDSIRNAICSRLTEHPDVDPSGIDVIVRGDEVTLEGTVASRVEKRIVEDLAASCRGVHDVHNRLRVEGPAVHIGKASE